VSKQEEQAEGQREVCDELRVRRRHAIPLAVHLSGAFLAYPSLQEEVQRFAAHLAREHQKNLDFTRSPDQSHIDDTESLRDESKPCREIGDWVMWILELERLSFPYRTS
jgi:hypothetical protein